MTKRMLIDATHAEETRVVVLDGNRLEDFDVETSTKRQLKGNIYLAKVVRVEPSLQACFVEYGGNRHGFLAFSEIHPDYYQIPVADRQRLIEQEAEEARREEEEADRELAVEPPARHHPHSPAKPREAPPLDAEAAESHIEPEATPPSTPEMHVDSAPDAAAAESDADAQTLEVATLAPAPYTDAHTGAPASENVTIVPWSNEHASAPASRALETQAREHPQTPETQALEHAAAIEAYAPDHSPASEPEAVAFAPEAEASAPASEPAASAQGPEAAVWAPDAAAPEATSPAETGDESGATTPYLAEPPTPAAASDQSSDYSAAPSDEAQPRSRRAQPMTIESETLTGPVETDTAPAEADSATDSGEPWGSQPDFDPQPHIAPSEPMVADTEEDTDLPFDDSDSIPESPPPETIGGEPDSADEQRERRPPSRYLRNYKIQEVIRRRQILLVQVVKEERGTKGAALTTYMSLAGRFSVLMPNSPRGGGVSRKITSATDRRRLKEIITELDMPKGMGLIVRTAGANRPKPEIKRDCEYLLRLWDDIREHTLKSVAPALIYEEASLIKRAIRDVYSRDIDEIQVDGEEGWRAAHEFMRMLMPSHAKKVIHWRDPSQPLFTKYQVEAQLDAMLQPTAQLRSGGYLVINQAEALVAIDVNSGRSTRERNVEETALRTNLEAADEVARQLRLRDLAGLIVIDFIDMEQKKHNVMVERRIKEALKNDRARIQVGHISHFGLLEMSRQRLRPSLTETSFILCPHCGGTGHVRSTENAAIHVLRGIEDEGSKRRAAEIVVHAATAIALYILNHKRDRLGEIERRYAMRVTLMSDETQVASQFRIDRMRPQIAREDVPAAITPDTPQATLPAPRWETEEIEEVAGEEEIEFEEAGGEDAAGEENGTEEAGAEGARSNGTETAEEKEEQAERRRRRRRRRRGGRREDGQPASPAEAESDGALVEPEPAPTEEQIGAEPAIAAADEDDPKAETHVEGVPEHTEPVSDEDARRRRGRRGGRRRRREPGDGEGSPFAAPGAEQPDLPPVYIGPTPANPFGGHAFDIFDVLEQVEASAALRQEPAEPVARQAVVELDAVAAPAERNGASEAAAPEDVSGLAGPVGMSEPAEPESVIAPVESKSVSEPAGQQGTGEAAQPDGLIEPVGLEDVVAQAKPQSVAAPAETPASSATVGAEIVNATAPEPAPVDAAGEPVAKTTAVQAATPEVAALWLAMPERAPAAVANDVAPEPAVKPIVIGRDNAPAEKKRGWWRR